MWYIDEHGKPYYLTDAKNKSQVMDSPPEVFSIRVLEPTDIIWDARTWYYKNGQTLPYSIYITKDQPQEVVVEWPEYSSFNTIVPLLSKQRNVPLKDAVLQYIDAARPSIYLNSWGYNIIGWTSSDLAHDEEVVIWINSDQSKEIRWLPILKQYLGKAFEFKDNYIRTSKTDWLLIVNRLKFNLKTLEQEEKEEYTKLYHKLTLIQQAIKTYMELITPEFMVQQFGELPYGVAFLTRCVGCRNLDANHLILHVHRKELPFFIVTDVAKNFGLDPWKMITNIKTGKLEMFEKFHNYLAIFLNHYLLPNSFLKETPAMFSIERWQKLNTLQYTKPATFHVSFEPAVPASGDVLYYDNMQVGGGPVGEAPIDDSPGINEGLNELLENIHNAQH